jgi:hypothetical protein
MVIEKPNGDGSLFRHIYQHYIFSHSFLSILPCRKIRHRCSLSIINRTAN